MSADTLHEREKPLEVDIPRNYEIVAWKWMRYSGILLIPLVWFHTILNDVVIGVHAIDIDYVAQRWASVGWRLYTAAILAFAFAHGMNGLRQILWEYFQSSRARRNLGWGLFIAWLLITAMGAIALIGGVRLEGVS
jgi:succinate dehydrogenase / fumarate reductase, membrane anchor subunit